MKKIILSLLVLSLIIIGCESENHDQQKDVVAEESHNEHDMHNAEHSQDDEEEHHSAFSLNNDEKWQMDDHTRASIATIQSLFEGKKEPASVTELNTFGSTLNTEFQTLIAGCTMTGDSHDQLHFFLELTLPFVSDLAENADQAELNDSYHEIHGLIEEYDLFFE